MTPLFRKFLGINWILFLVMGLLMAFGILCIYSAVHFREGEELGKLATMWNVQLKWALLGLVPFFLTALLDYKWIRWGALPMYVIAMILMVMVQVRGESVHGSQSWLAIGGFRFQPSQMGICATILFGGLILADGQKFLPILRYHLLRCLAALIVFGGTLILILLEGDLGSAMVITPVIVFMLIIGGIPFRYLLAGGLASAIVLPWAFFMVLKPHQQSRITVWWRMLHGQTVDLKGDAWASYNNHIAIATGGWEGKNIYQKVDPDDLENENLGEQTLPHMVGLGNVSQKTAHTDYIFTVLAESFGFRVSGLLITLFLLILLLLLTVAFFARDTMGRVVVAGVAGLIFGHTFEHVGMNIGLVPITGIPLPFISYGGTFLMVVMFLFGLVQSVWVHRNIMLESENSNQRASRSGGNSGRQLNSRLSPA